MKNVLAITDPSDFEHSFIKKLLNPADRAEALGTLQDAARAGK